MRDGREKLIRDGRDGSDGSDGEKKLIWDGRDGAKKLIWSGRSCISDTVGMIMIILMVKRFNCATLRGNTKR